MITVDDDNALVSYDDVCTKLGEVERFYCGHCMTKLATKKKKKKTMITSTSKNSDDDDDDDVKNSSTLTAAEDNSLDFDDDNVIFLQHGSQSAHGCQLTSRYSSLCLCT